MKNPIYVCGSCLDPNNPDHQPWLGKCSICGLDGQRDMRLSQSIDPHGYTVEKRYAQAICILRGLLNATETRDIHHHTQNAKAVIDIFDTVYAQPKEKVVDTKTCSTCGCETSNYTTIHSAIICDECEMAMMLTDKKLLLSDGKNFWMICDQCHTPGPFRPTPKQALQAAIEEFAIDGSATCLACCSKLIREAEGMLPPVVNDYPADIDDVNDMKL